MMPPPDGVPHWDINSGPPPASSTPSAEHQEEWAEWYKSYELWYQQYSASYGQTDYPTSSSDQDTPPTEPVKYSFVSMITGTLATSTPPAYVSATVTKGPVLNKTRHQTSVPIPTGMIAPTVKPTVSDVCASSVYSKPSDAKSTACAAGSPVNRSSSSTGSSQIVSSPSIISVKEAATKPQGKFIYTMVLCFMFSGMES